MIAAVRRLMVMTGASTALQEILYGFIMSLIFVYATLFGILAYDDPINFIWVVVGMNVTWGTIDAVIFYYLEVCDQRRYVRLMSGKGINMTREQRVETLMNELSASPLDVLKSDEQREFCEKMLDREIESDEELKADRRSMAMSSVGTFLFTVMTLIPIIVPVLVIPDFFLALNIATHLSSTILFFVGFFMGPYLGVNRFVSGAVLFLLAWSIALIATFTGG